MRDRRTIASIACLLLAFLTGCSPTRNESSKIGANTSTNQLSGAEIWKACRQTYETATSYRDQAVVYLSYRMQGQLIQEPQPWSVTWSNSQKLSANLFNAQLRSDGARMSCFVYDNDTANLDNQWLVLEQPRELPLSRLAQDNLARYFLGGFSEFPLDESPNAQLPALVPPTIGWLTHQWSWPIFENPRLIERLKDAKVDDQPCFHLRIHGDQLSSEIWIDQASKLVRQMTLATELLDPAVRTAVEVSDIQFFARFHQAELNLQTEEKAFALDRPQNAVPVQQFVAIPEPFPCGQIGEHSENLPLFGPSGDLQALKWDEGPTVLVWISGLIGQESLAEIRQLKSSLAGKDARWIGVFADDHRDPSSQSTRQLLPELRNWMIQNELKCEWLYDSQLNASSQLKLESLPAAVVISKAGVVQYAVSLGAPQWQEHLSGAIQRVSAGESIAAEMLADYQSYLERYKKRLLLVSAERRATTSHAAAGPNSSKLQVAEIWRQTTLKRPGNLYAIPQKTGLQLFAFDGWQSIAEIDRSGTVLRHHKLDVPEGVALNTLRRTSEVSAPGMFAAFSTLGHEIYVFDDDWRRIDCLSREVNSARDSILDCRFQRTPDGQEILCVAWKQSGLMEYDLQNKSWKPLTPTTCESLAIIQSECFAISEGKLLSRNLTPGWGLVQGLEGQAVRVESFRIPEVPPSILVSSVDDAGIWRLSKFSLSGEVQASSEIGPQLFESAAEPASFTEGGGGFVAWADSLNCIHVFDWNLKPIGVWQVDSDLLSVEAIWNDGQLELLISTINSLQAVRVDTRQSQSLISDTPPDRN